MSGDGSTGGVPRGEGVMEEGISLRESSRNMDAQHLHSDTPSADNRSHESAGVAWDFTDADDRADCFRTMAEDMLAAAGFQHASPFLRARVLELLVAEVVFDLDTLVSEHAHRLSWAELGRRMSVSKSQAHARWSKPPMPPAHWGGRGSLLFDEEAS